MTTTMKLVNIITLLTFFFLLIRTFKSYSLSNF